MNWGGIYHFPRRRGREDRIPCRDTDEGPEVGSDGKKKSKTETKPSQKEGVIHMKWIIECRGKKEGEKKKRSCDGDRPAARSDPLLIWSNPPHRLGVGVWALFVFGCLPAICHSEWSNAPLNQSPRRALASVHCTHVSAQEAVFAHVNKWARAQSIPLNRRSCCTF